MPSLTIYISKADAKLVKEAKASLGRSLSSVFAEAIRRKMKHKLGIAEPPKPKGRLT